MNPVASIDKNLVLQGDFVIQGPVKIQRSLNVTGDVLSSNSELGLRKLGEMGLKLSDSNLTRNRLVFKDVVQVRENFNAETINNVPVDNFIKLDINQEQSIRGKKIFKKNLLVKGSLEVKVVNDVDLNQLDATTVKQVSNATQLIDGNVQIASLQVDQLVSPTAKLNGKNIDMVLSRKKSQKLVQMRAENVKVKSFNTNNVEHKIGSKVLGNDINFLIDDTITKDSFVDTVIAEKKFKNLKVKNLQFAEGNEWKDIVGNFESILQGFNISHDVVLDNEMEIKSLTVKGKINGISYDDMINHWLKLEGDQSFSAPQNFKKLNAQQNVNLATINGENVEKLLEESIYIDEPITLENLQINGRLAVNTKLLTPLVNGAIFNEKLIINNTQEIQVLKKLQVDGNAFIQHLNYTYLNGINCNEFFNVFNGNEEPLPSIKIVGKATFSRPINVTFLNNANVQELYDIAWLSNRNVQLIGDDIQFLDESRIDDQLFIDVSLIFN